MKEKLQRFWGNFKGSAFLKTIKRVDFGLAVAGTFIGLVLYAYAETSGRNAAGLRFLENVEARSLDARFNLRGERPHDQNIVIVGLDEKTLQQVGAFPIPRNDYAKMVDELAKDGASIVAFDEAFPVPEKNSAVEALKKLQGEVQGRTSPQVLEQIRDLQAKSNNDAILAESLKRAGNVVLAHLFLDPDRAKSVSQPGAEAYLNTLSMHSFPQVIKLKHGRDFDLNRTWLDVAQGLVAQGVFANIPLLADSARSFGFFDEEPDPDGSYRRAILMVRYQDQDFYPSLDVETVRQLRNIKDDDLIVYMAENGVDHIELGPELVRPAHDGTALINFAGPYKTYKHYSMIDVIDGRFTPGTFRNKIVVFGPTAVAIGDIRNTPFLISKEGRRADYMGVELHANTIDNLLHADERGRGFLRRGYREEAIDLCFIVALGFGLGYWFSRTPPLTATLSLIVALALFSGIVYGAFSYFGMWLSFVIPAGTLVTNYASITSFRMIFEEREKRKVRKTFERYVSPGVIALIEKDPKKYFKPGGESKELTVMFSDIRSFTTIAEGLTPDELVFLLNQYLGEMTDILFRRWGTLDKYIGDAIMGFWGSPFPQTDHAIRACSCALDMRARLQELNVQWLTEGRKKLAIGIGINTGEVNVGNMGSTRRFSWTVMGDNVNLASRLEGITKEYHVQCVVSESTYRATKDQFVFREIDRIKVKGKTLPVTIYELLDWAKNEELYTERIVRFSEALTAYRRQQWDEAIELFTTLKDKFPDDGPCETFIARAHELMEAPPEPEWDGVYAMKTK
ncbi:MAG: adenylate/guanylate cyclase domain-containing protein [Acidobacteria bacterium]|nr:adenylate/guanylate cyclase domain-containing protein [Acidobacteriota bacterium]